MKGKFYSVRHTKKKAVPRYQITTKLCDWQFLKMLMNVGHKDKMNGENGLTISQVHINAPFDLYNMFQATNKAAISKRQLFNWWIQFACSFIIRYKTTHISPTWITESINC